MSLSTRLAKLEALTASLSLTVRDAIDRPPQETREQWIARISGNSLPGLVNSRGESREQWVARRESKLSVSAIGLGRPGP